MSLSLLWMARSGCVQSTVLVPGMTAVGLVEQEPQQLLQLGVLDYLEQLSKQQSKQEQQSKQQQHLYHVNLERAERVDSKCNPLQGQTPLQRPQY